MRPGGSFQGSENAFTVVLEGAVPPWGKEQRPMVRAAPILIG